MSLTSHLKDPKSPVHGFVREHFPNTRSVVRAANADLKGAQTIRPAGAVHWGTVGTAIDHRIRYHFGPAHEAGALRGGAFMLERGMMRGTLHEDPETLDTLAVQTEAFRRSIPAFFAKLDEDLSRLRPWQDLRRFSPDDEALLCRNCVGLALFEQVFRVGRVSSRSPLVEPSPAWTADELLARVPDLWVDDLRELSWAFLDSHGDLSRGVHKAALGPTFEGSLDVGGADADLVLDGLLVDVKTTTNAKIAAEMLYQLLGYVLLDYSNRLGVWGVAVYLSRQRRLVRWALDELLEDLGAARDLPELREAFSAALRPSPA